LYDLDWGYGLNIPKTQPENLEEECVWFRSPEPGPGHTCNVWTAGVMFYIMLHGFPPFFKQSSDKMS